jgi:hypothetical protein
MPDRKTFLLNQLNAPRCKCRRQFPAVEEAKREQLQQAEQEIEKKFEPQIQAIEKERRELQGTEQREALETKMAELMDEQDRQVEAEMRNLQIEVPVSDLKPSSLKTEAEKKAGGDKAKESQLRQQEILQMLREQPPRRTVTGSYRVH